VLDLLVRRLGWGSGDVGAFEWTNGLFLWVR